MKKGAPKYLMLSMYSDGTYNIDFFDDKEKAKGWKDFEEGKNGKYDRTVECTIYEPAKEE